MVDEKYQAATITRTRTDAEFGQVGVRSAPVLAAVKDDGVLLSVVLNVEEHLYAERKATNWAPPSQTGVHQ
jgi:hypothetical protein